MGDNSLLREKETEPQWQAAHTGSGKLFQYLIIFIDVHIM